MTEVSRKFGAGREPSRTVELAINKFEDYLAKMTGDGAVPGLADILRSYLQSELIPYRGRQLPDKKLSEVRTLAKCLDQLKMGNKVEAANLLLRKMKEVAEARRLGVRPRGKRRRKGCEQQR